MAKGKSPIDILIDQACNVPANQKTPERLSTKAEKEAASQAGTDLLHYIDEMYPELWEGLTSSKKKSARTSIRNTVHNRIIHLLKNPPN